MKVTVVKLPIFSGIEDNIHVEDWTETLAMIF